MADSADAEDKYVQRIQAFPESEEKRVISFVLYGSDPKYTRGAVRNAQLKDRLFPGWECRFYVTPDVPPSVVHELQETGADTIEVSSPGMHWRFMPADDPSVDRFIVRDVDSRLNTRDRIAVEEWIRSNLSLHVMRDHPCHSHYPMNGGMWGLKKGALNESMSMLVNKWAALQNAWLWYGGQHEDVTSKYMADMEFLKSEIWPRLWQDSITHDTYSCQLFEGKVFAFPTQRPFNFQHVGQVFDAEDNPRMSDIVTTCCGSIMAKTYSPPECRRHKSWMYG